MCRYLLSVGVMLPLMAVLSAAWIDVDPVSCNHKTRLKKRHTENTTV